MYIVRNGIWSVIQLANKNSTSTRTFFVIFKFSTMLILGEINSQIYVMIHISTYVDGINYFKQTKKTATHGQRKLLFYQNKLNIISNPTYVNALYESHLI